MLVHLSEAKVEAADALQYLDEPGQIGPKLLALVAQRHAAELAVIAFLYVHTAMASHLSALVLPPFLLHQLLASQVRPMAPQTHSSTF
jgi:hypothetical protein